MVEFYGILTILWRLMPNLYYIYIYLLIKYLPAFTEPEKKKGKKAPGTRDKSISNHRPGGKEKIISQKERKGQPRPTP